jgi:hypothetical protein
MNLVYNNIRFDLIIFIIIYLYLRMRAIFQGKGLT